MEKVIEKLHKVLGEDTAVFCIAHENESPDASVILDGTPDVFTDAILNTVLSENVDHAEISKSLWNILLGAMANIIARDPQKAREFLNNVQAMQEQLVLSNKAN